MPDRDPRLDVIKAVASEVTGDETLTLSDPQRLTHSRFQYGVSPGYGRAHVSSPGMPGTCPSPSAAWA